ncbi:hypothetical protein [Flavobacterium cerinum]|uniref:Uncharacterized protein n=1 Tax=Flavobacterium cerinum TaxID=2502784 RepID=A0ABY5IT98_9FLAO|nr:hypothetical protein [Flavobacterium cerinum]UUC45551.1 hypothetical protein NOX80_18265 [Flavobacterium cerinum]
MKKTSRAYIPIGLLFLLLEIRIEKSEPLLKYGLLFLATLFFIAGFVTIVKNGKGNIEK